MSGGTTNDHGPGNDPFLFRLVVCVLGAIALVATSGIVWIGLEEQDIPPALAGVAIGAASAMTGVLAAMKPPGR